MKILGTDFDNTLFFTNDKETTTRNIEAIRKFMHRGNLFFVISGRTFKEIKQELINLQLPYTYLVCGDGALIFDGNNKCLKCVKLENTKIEAALKILRENGYDPYLEDGFIITNDMDKCIKISSTFIKDKEDASKIAKIINEKLDLYAYTSSEHINVNNPVNNKKQAIYSLAEVANLNVNDIYVIGDDVNDYEMLGEFKSATVKKHNPIIDKLNIPVYNTLADYIEDLLDD